MGNLGISNYLNAINRASYDVAMAENLVLRSCTLAESTKQAYMNPIIEAIGEILMNDDLLASLPC